MDGTLLDRHFDNFFFEEELPRRYAGLHGLGFEDARQRLFALYRAVEGELDWTDLHYWTRTLGIDVVEMTREFQHMIDFHPDAEPFLQELKRRRKRAHLVTNAHTSGLSIKLARTNIDRYLDRVICAFDIGYLKMREEFWPTCRQAIGFDPSRTVYVDDDEGCLEAARRYGIRHVIHRSKSSSQQPPQPSPRFRSVESLHMLLG
jgi:putative hydrolase of the HAD superfamily